MNPLARDPVEIQARRAMTPARKARIHAQNLGRCGECDRDLPVSGPAVEYDHILPLKLGGRDDDVNCQLLCPACHLVKTRFDIARIAKAKRLSGETGQDRKRREIKSRGFDRTLTKGFDGKVRSRPLSPPTLKAADGEAGR